MECGLGKGYFHFLPVIRFIFQAWDEIVLIEFHYFVVRCSLQLAINARTTAT